MASSQGCDHEERLAADRERQLTEGVLRGGGNAWNKQLSWGIDLCARFGGLLQPELWSRSALCRLGFGGHGVVHLDGLLAERGPLFIALGLVADLCRGSSP